MSIKQWIEQQKAEGNFQEFIVYANIGNNSDELVVCTADDADDVGCVIVDVDMVQHNAFYRSAVIIAEVA